MMTSDLLNKKLDRWEHKLLDLSKRNKMINYRETKRTTLKLVEPSFADFFNRIAINEETLTFQRSVDKETDIRVFSILSLLENLSSPLPVTVGDIKTEGSIIERQKTLRNMRAKSRLALEEQGTNILYLSFGFIEWKTNKGSSDQLIKSPLILVPAVLSLDALNSPYTLSKYEDDIVINPTLEYYLENEYGIKLSHFDDDNDNIDDFLKELEEIADKRGWRIIREVSLGLLSFLKITMYNDLVRNEERIKNNPVIKAMSGDVELVNDIPEKMRSFDLDSIAVQDCYQVMSADSSQQEAILYSKNNVSFVMQGPPGTGKSQTITNIIAEALADNKKILFVSEKMAALQVVYRRLQETHLSDFCLPLHSYKANKKDILEQIGANLSLKQLRVKDSAMGSLEELFALRQELNRYALELHRLNQGLNISCYDVYSKLEELHSAPTVTFTINNPLDVSQAQFQAYISALREYLLSVNRLENCIKDNPWEGLISRTTGYEYSERMRNELTTLRSTLLFYTKTIGSIHECADFMTVINYAAILELPEILHKICILPNVPKVWLRKFDICQAISNAREAKCIYNKLFDLQNKIDGLFYSGIYEYDYNKWKNQLSAIVNNCFDTPLFRQDSSEYYINNAHTLLGILASLKCVFISINDEFSSINALLGSSFVPNQHSLQILRDLYELISNNKVFHQAWFSCKTDEIETILYQAETHSINYNKYRHAILNNWIHEILPIEYAEKYLEKFINYPQTLEKYIKWKENLYSEAETIASLPLLKGWSANEIIDNRYTLTKHFASLKAQVTTIIATFDSVNKLGDFDFFVSKANSTVIVDLCACINANIVIPSIWFTSQYNDICLLYKQASKNAESIKKLKNELSEAWEDEIFSMDYSSMLTRYKADYTSVFKSFKKQYRIDRRQIQTLSRKVIKKPNDNLVIELLTRLKEYYVLEEWFENKHNELKNAFSTYFSGIQTDWELIKNAFQSKDDIISVLECEPSDTFKSILAADHKREGALLSSYANILTDAFDKIEGIAVASPGVYNEAIYNSIDQAHAKLSHFCENALSLNTILRAAFGQEQYNNAYSIEKISESVISNRNAASLINHISNMRNFLENATWFSNNEANLNAQFSNDYHGVDSQWTLLKSYFEQTCSIRSVFSDNVPSTLIDILSSDHQSSINQFETSLVAILSSFDYAKSSVIENNILISIDADAFDINNAISIIDTYVIKLNDISTQMDLLKPYLHNANERVEIIYLGIDTLNSYTKTQDLLSTLSTQYIQQYDFFYLNERTDWDNIIALLEEVSDAKQSKLFKSLTPIVNAPKSRKQELLTLSLSILDVLGSSHEAFEWISSQFSPDLQLEKMTFMQLTKKIDGCLQNIEILGNWIDYQEAKEVCCNIGLSDFIAEIEKAEIYTDIERGFLKGFYGMWLGALCDKSSSLRKFRRNAHDERIKQFVELDNLQLLISQIRICEKLIDNLPSSHRMLRATDEVAILNKELSKKRNIMPLRKLFKLIPNLLMRLKPCLMMSPLSVSYFLETEAYHFDLVIFDEASQIFPEDAIGAIFRGSQVIIAGDSKQMPPTNFFAATTDNADSEYDIDDDKSDFEIVSDSILEETASILPSRTLLWHYRSKYESLIAFSNREIYKNSLLTFPNTVNNIADTGVEYIYVSNGCYEGGGKNCNIREAQKCVMLVLQHIQRHPERSLGIIAFSDKQQVAIENAIIDFRGKMPEYEWFFNESKEEPFFVKNLENVQGDERDTIIFSICYAKDKNGRMYMRFGPLGHDGGERRLNVAITRAKCNIKLVGSILPSDIDLERTNSDGVRMLRSYIEFAQNGTSALKPAKQRKEFASSDEFCNIVALFLQKNGYDIQRNIGCSDYRIDIAIKDPNANGEYIAGIECDGLSYAQAKTARDRDHLRKSILENMGWKLYRVWSTEWYRNSKAEKSALLSFIHSLLNKSDNGTNTNRPRSEVKDDIEIERIADESEKIEFEVPKYNPYGFAYYEKANWWDVPHYGISDNLTRISNIVAHIVEVEQPIHIELLYRRMGPSFTTGKATESVRKTIDQALENKLKNRIMIDSDHFVRLIPLSPIVVRVPRENDTPRPMEFIHTEEVALAMEGIAKNTYGIAVEDLAIECAKAFGFERMGLRIRQKTDAAIHFLDDTDVIHIIDGKVSLV